MRRAFAIATFMALMLAAPEAALAQSPNLQMQPRVPMIAKPSPGSKTLPRVQTPGRPPPNMPLIKPSQALIIAQRFVPNSKGVDVRLLPGGNYVVTVKRKNQVQRVIVDGDTGAPR